MQGSELEILRNIPGFKVVMKAILRHQIQMLVQQLYDHVGEEAVLLTASVSDGSSGYLGSESGKVFVEDHDEIMTQFLGYCMERQCMRSTEDNPGLDPGPNYHSTPLVHRNFRSLKRPAPYLKNASQGRQRAFGNKGQTHLAKQMSSTVEFDLQQDIQNQEQMSKKESQEFSNEETGDFNSVAEMTGSSVLSQADDDNSQESVSANPASLNIGENSNEAFDVGTAGLEGLPEDSVNSQWGANSTATGEGSMNQGSQEHVDGETPDGEFRMIMIEKRERKPRKPLTLEQRVFALELLNSGLSARKTALSLGVGRSQIHDIIKRRDEIMADWQSESVNPGRKRRSRKTGNEEINSMCLKWYHEAIAHGYQVSGPVLQAKALELAVQLGISSFKASNGWLERFRKRHMIVTAGQIPKGSHSEKKGKNKSEAAESKLDESVLPEGVTKHLDDTYIQDHVERALKSMGNWTGEEAQLADVDKSEMHQENCEMENDIGQTFTSHDLTDTCNVNIEGGTTSMTNGASYRFKDLRTDSKFHDETE